MAHHELLWDKSAANFALKALTHSMGVDVLLLVGGLVECRIAALHRTFKWFLASVNADVVEQIVPFGEDFLTSLERADVGVCQSAARNSHVTKDDKILGFRDRCITSG